MAILLLIEFLWASSPLFAAVPDLHFIVSGNWCGQFAVYPDVDTIEPLPVWKTPELINGLKRRYPNTLVIGVGNDSSERRPESILLDGLVEQSLFRDCGFDIGVVGPGDLNCLKQWQGPRSDLFQRVWTNVEAGDGALGFQPFKRVQKSGRTIGVGCLISPQALADCPLFSMGNYTIEDPARGLHRLEFLLGEIDLLLLVCHMNKKDVSALRGIVSDRTRIIWVPTEPLTDMEKHVLTTNRCPNMWLVPEANRSLLSILLEAREGGKTVESIRRLPLSELEPGGESPAFTRVKALFSKKLCEPIRVLSATEFPFSTSFQFKASIQAAMARRLMRSDLAFVGIEREPLKIERVINVWEIVHSIIPKHLREYTLSGDDLKQFIHLFLRKNRSLRLGVDGGFIQFLGANVKEFFIGDKPVDDKAIYRVTFDETLFEDEALKSVFQRLPLSGRLGWTLWDAWLGELANVPRGKKLIKQVK